MKEFLFLYQTIHQEILLGCVDNAMVLSEGKIVAKGTPQELVKNTRAIEAYFGEGFKF